MHLTAHLWPQHVAYILRIPIMCRQHLILPLNGFLYHMYLSYRGYHIFWCYVLKYFQAML